MVMGGFSSNEITKRLIVGLTGLWPTDEEWLWLRQWKPAGIILFSRNVECFSQLQSLCSALKRWVPGLEIMADHEGGPVSQLAAALGRPPVAWSLGKLDDVELTTRVHEETGKRMKLAGLDRVLGPCSDVMTEAHNPVIGARSFGADSELVSRQVRAAIAGFKLAGLSCCLKHWPGHGSSGTDSHLENAWVSLSPEDEEPFVSGLKAGADAVMVGHLLFDDSGIPASLSSSFLEKTRTALGQGVGDFILMADDVSMGALREPMALLGVHTGVTAKSMVEVEDLNLRWFEELLKAGCDQLLLRGIPFGAFALNEGDERSAELPLQTLFGYSENLLAGPEFSDDPYNNARCQSPFEFDSRSDDLAYLDLARADRWQVAGGQNLEHWQQWDKILNEKFANIWQFTHLDQAFAGRNTLSNLLITSHRPLPMNWENQSWGQSIKNCLANSGVCLVMGHPSLALDFEAFLGEKWKIKPLYDVCCEELSLVLE